MKFLNFCISALVFSSLSFAQDASSPPSVDESLISEIISFSSDKSNKQEELSDHTPALQYELAREILVDKQKSSGAAFQLLKLSAESGYPKAIALLKTLN